jgi:hypothetical protein
MELYRSELEGAIREARRRGFLDEPTKLIVFGRISYAAERGDITVREALALEDAIEPRFGAKYGRNLQAACLGSLDDAPAPAEAEAVA